MRKFAIVGAAVMLFPLLLAAQSRWPNAPLYDDTGRVTVFGGYSYLRNNGNGSNGFDVQGTYNLNRYLGVTGDVSGDYRSPAAFTISGVTIRANQRLYTYLFGPTVTANGGRASVFGHALFGMARSSLGAGVNLPVVGGISTGLTSANAFAMQFGGGLDYNVSSHMAIRVAQVDYLRTQFNATDALTTGLTSGLNGHQNFMRYSAGIVFRF